MQPTQDGPCNDGGPWTRWSTPLSIVSLTLMFVVLYSRYKSAALSALIMVNIPLALVGAVAYRSWLWAPQVLLDLAVVGYLMVTAAAAIIFLRRWFLYSPMEPSHLRTVLCSHTMMSLAILSRSLGGKR